MRNPHTWREQVVSRLFDAKRMIYLLFLSLSPLTYTRSRYTGEGRIRGQIRGIRAREVCGLQSGSSWR